MKKTSKFIIYFLLFIGLFLGWFAYKRHFYCISENKCVTVWKRIGGKCYIIPGKYYGITTPQNYVEAGNLDDVDVIWVNQNNLIINGNPDLKFVNKHTNKFKIINYDNNKKLNDSLYLDFDGKYHRYKNNLEFIQLHIREPYATDKKGNKL